MDAKKLFLEHFEKLALLIACALLAGFVATRVIAVNPADTQRDKVQRLNRQIQQKAGEATSQAPRPEPETAARDVQHALDGGADPARLTDWLVYKRPKVITRKIGDEIPEPHHYPPVLEAPAGDLGRITLKWEDDGRDDKVVVDAYDLFRSDADPNDPSSWKKIATLGKADKTYTDADLTPKKDYFYRLESLASIDVANDKVKQALAHKHQIDLPEAERRLSSITRGPVQTKPDVHLELLSVQLKSTPADILQGKPDQQAMAMIMVWKYFPEKKDEDGTVRQAQWKSHQYSQVTVGQRIGAKEQESGSKLGEFDFTTDFVLKDTKNVSMKRAESDIAVTADVAVLEDTNTKQPVEINNVVPDPEIGAIKGQRQKPVDEKKKQDKPAIRE